MAIYSEELDGNLIDNSKKKELIKEIKETIKEYGEFSIGEIEPDSEPVVPNQKGNLIHFIEYFNLDTVEVSVYSESAEIEVDNYFLNYEELDVETLEEIVDMCEIWADIQEDDYEE